MEDWKKQLEDRTKEKDRLQEELVKAKADAFTAGAPVTEADRAKIPALQAASRGAHAAGATGMTAADAELLNLQKREEAYKKLAAAQYVFDNQAGQVENAKSKLFKAQEDQKNFDDETKRMEAHAIALKTFADETNRAADAQERLTQAHESGLGAHDAAEDAALQQRRRNELMQRGNEGRLSPAEQAEAAGAFSRNPFQDMRDTQSRIAQIEQNTRLNMGHVSAEDFAALQRLNDKLIGLMESILAQGQRTQSRLGHQHDRIEELERHFSETDSYLRNSRDH